MPVLYKTIQSTMKNKDGNKLFHPRTIYVGSVNTEKDRPGNCGVFLPFHR